MGKMSRTTQDISSEIRYIIGQHLKYSAEDLDASTIISTLPNVDSMRLLEVIMDVEKRYRIEIPDSAPFRITTVGEFENLVLSLVNK